MAPLQRLTRRAEFQTVAASRHKSVAPGLILQAHPRPMAETLRVGFTASRKVGNAVARNRARRRLRAAAAALMPRHAARGHDYVMVARAGTLTRPFGQLLGDLLAGLRRLGVYRE